MKTGVEPRFGVKLMPSRSRSAGNRWFAPVPLASVLSPISTQDRHVSELAGEVLDGGVMAYILRPA